MLDIRRGGPAAACRTGWQPCSSAKQPAAGHHCWAKAAPEPGMLAAADMAFAACLPLAALIKILHSISSQIALGSGDRSTISLWCHLSCQALAGERADRRLRHGCSQNSTRAGACHLLETCPTACSRLRSCTRLPSSRSFGMAMRLQCAEQVVNCRTHTALARCLLCNDKMPSCSRCVYLQQALA